jgi:predicted RNase H-like HicB family nuclease
MAKKNAERRPLAHAAASLPGRPQGTTVKRVPRVFFRESALSAWSPDRPGESAPILFCPVYLVPEPEGGFSAAVATLPGCYSQGNTEDEALANIAEALEGVLDTYKARGLPIPWRKPARRPAGSLPFTVGIHT